MSTNHLPTSEAKLAGAVTRISGKPLLRISPHIYNSADEMDQLVALIA